MDQTSNQMIPLFVPELNKENGQPQEAYLSLNAKITALFDTHSPVKLIVSYIRSEEARFFLRSLFMQNVENNKSDFAKEASIFICNGLQVSYTNDGQPVLWAYVQIGDGALTQQIQAITFLSSCLIIEIGAEEEYRKIQRFYKQNKELTKTKPKIIKLSSQNFEHQQTDSYISIPKGWPAVQALAVQKYFRQANKIVLQSSYLICDQGKKVSAKFYSSFLATFLEITKKSLNALFSSSVERYQTELKSKSLKEYHDRMAKLQNEKKLISNKLIRSTHQISLEMSMKSIQKFHFFTENFIEQLTNCINLEGSSVAQEIMKTNFDYGRQFIQSEYSQIESRLKSKQMKSVVGLKNELTLFIQYFHKKMEMFSCKQLQIFFNEFLLTKSLQLFNHIFEAERLTLRSDLDNYKNKASLAEQETKQLKKQLLKQCSQYQRAINNLKLDLDCQKNKESLLSQTILRLKQVQSESQLENDQKIKNMQKDFLQQIKDMQQKLTCLQDQKSFLKRRVVFLEAQNEKEKKMREQSEAHFQMILEESHRRESQLSAKIQETDLKSSISIQIHEAEQRLLKQSSTTKAEKQKDHSKWNQKLFNLTSEKEELERRVQNLEYEMELKSAENQAYKNDLEVSLKMAEQKICQLEYRNSKLDKLQTDIELFERALEAYKGKDKQNQKSLALSYQQNTFLQQKLKEMSERYQSQRVNGDKMKEYAEKMEQKIGRASLITVNEWVQTQNDYSMKNMLEEAFKIVENLETQYQKIKIQNLRMKRMLNNSF